MWSDWVSGAVIVACVAWALLHLERLPGLPSRLRGRRRPPVAVPPPRARPFECIAHDVIRLGARFHGPTDLPFVKYEAVRRAYDDVLGEACDALAVPHLLGVLPPGPDRDEERMRVERALRSSGLGAAA